MSSAATPHAALLESYAGDHRHLMAALVKCPKTMWQWKPAPGKWSLHEIVVHVADTEAHFYLRMRHALAEPGTVICAFDQDKWATGLSYTAQSADDALDLIRLVRKMTAALLEKQPADAWQRAVEHPERGTLTLEAMVQHAVSHTATHIRQIERVFGEWQAQQQVTQA